MVDCDESLGAVRCLGDAGGRVCRHARGQRLAWLEAAKNATANRSSEAATTPDGTGQAPAIFAEATRLGVNLRNKARR